MGWLCNILLSVWLTDWHGKIVMQKLPWKAPRASLGSTRLPLRFSLCIRGVCEAAIAVKRACQPQTLLCHDDKITFVTDGRANSHIVAPNCTFIYIVITVPLFTIYTCVLNSTQKWRWSCLTDKTVTLSSWQSNGFIWQASDGAPAVPFARYMSYCTYVCRSTSPFGLPAFIRPFYC